MVRSESKLRTKRMATMPTTLARAYATGWHPARHLDTVQYCNRIRSYWIFVLEWNSKFVPSLLYIYYFKCSILCRTAG